MHRGCYLIGYRGRYLIYVDILIELLQAIDKFNFTFSYSASDIDSIGDANQVSVFEFYACALVAVVEEDVEASGSEVGGYFFTGSEEGSVTDVGDGDDDLEWGNGWVEGVSRAIVGGGGGLDGGG